MSRKRATLPSHRIETRKVADLRPADYNPRKIDKKAQAGLTASIERFGAVQPIIVNDRTGNIVGGHQRLKSLVALGQTETTVVVIDVDEVEEKALNVALNNPHIAGEFTDALGDILASVQGADESLFCDLRLDELLEDAPAKPKDGETDPDDVPEAPADPVTRPGDLWVMGSHRLICGDSTDAGIVSALMKREQAALCFTSPPYGQQRDYEDAKEKCADWDALMMGVFGAAPLRKDAQLLVNLGLIHRDGEWQPYWDRWIAWMAEQGWRRFGWYVWDQGPGMPGDWSGRLAPAHEFIWHFNRAPVKPLKARECKHAGEGHSGGGQRGADGSVKKRSAGHDVIQSHAIHDSVFRVNRQGASRNAGNHPAPYPVGLPTIAMQSWPGLAFEPFSGSGTTIIAGEQTGCPVRAIELTPAYVDIAVTRWQAFTGKEATLDGDGRTFAEIKAERLGEAA